jgi:hypothetical protein
VLVAVTGFGSVWRHRPGKQTHENGRFDQPVYYNTTGVVVNGHVRQRPQICGYARFDAIGGFDPNRPSRMINRVFECEEPSVWMGCNKLLFKRVRKASERPDSFLVVTRSTQIGHLGVGTEGWRSPDTWLLAFSECAEQQEAMLLVTACGWIQSAFGRFVLESSETRPGTARLVLGPGQS